MSIVAAFQPTLPSTDRGRLRAALAAVGRRLAASPLDNSVLQAVAAPTAPNGRPTRLRARWHTVTAPDGTARLEASWHPGR
ncbi:hypothetical protein [Kitasatospora aureofaciens]|uniref:hypothetical protein n=1 Tax=Kitasatospora aureofaciens TaxID=1894 RepID=UPI000525F7AA|nr:hypothetical protein [Kitasatospora aureofaciens]HJD81861.1 hypothetical protein [Kitasatospora aureofaciens]